MHYTTLKELGVDVIKLVFIVDGSCNYQRALFLVKRRGVLRLKVGFPKTCFKQKSVQIKRNFIELNLDFKFTRECLCLLFYPPSFQ